MNWKRILNRIVDATLSILLLIFVLILLMPTMLIAIAARIPKPRKKK